MNELVFNVTRDEDGNLCACAETPQGAIATDARTLDELVAMIRDVMDLYNEDATTKIEAFSLRFSSPTIVAA
ncbi:MAG TPA: hypothetical protein ENO21_00415 [Firmicutes bacterium]|nr:hypothetical protein [Bacillota bacterium]